MVEAAAVEKQRSSGDDEPRGPRVPVRGLYVIRGREAEDPLEATGLLGLYGTSYRFTKPERIPVNPRTIGLPLLPTEWQTLQGSPVLPQPWVDQWMQEELPRWINTAYIPPPVCVFPWTWSPSQGTCTIPSSSLPSPQVPLTPDVDAPPPAPPPPPDVDAPPPAPDAPPAPGDEGGVPDAPDAPQAPDDAAEQPKETAEEVERREREACAKRGPGHKWDAALKCMTRPRCHVRNRQWDPNDGCLQKCTNDAANLVDQTCRPTFALTRATLPVAVRLVSLAISGPGEVSKHDDGIFETVPFDMVIQTSPIQPMCAFSGYRAQLTSVVGKVPPWLPLEEDRRHVLPYIVNPSACTWAKGVFDKTTWTCNDPSNVVPAPTVVRPPAPKPAWSPEQMQVLVKVVVPTIDWMLSFKWLDDACSSALPPSVETRNRIVSRLALFARAVWTAMQVPSSLTLASSNDLQTLWTWLATVSARLLLLGTAVRSAGGTTCATTGTAETCGVAAKTCMPSDMDAPYMIHVQEAKAFVGAVSPDGQLYSFTSALQPLPSHMPLNAVVSVSEQTWNTRNVATTKERPPPSLEQLNGLPSCLPPLCPLGTVYSIADQTCLTASSADAALVKSAGAIDIEIIRSMPFDEPLLNATPIALAPPPRQPRLPLRPDPVDDDLSTEPPTFEPLSPPRPTITTPPAPRHSITKITPATTRRASTIRDGRIVLIEAGWPRYTRILLPDTERNRILSR